MTEHTEAESIARATGSVAATVTHEHRDPTTGELVTDATETWTNGHAADALDPADSPEWIDVRPTTTADDPDSVTLTDWSDPFAVTSVYRHTPATDLPSAPPLAAWLADFATRTDADTFAATFNLPVTHTSADPDECQRATYPTGAVQ